MARQRPVDPGSNVSATSFGPGVEQDPELIAPPSHGPLPATDDAAQETAPGAQQQVSEEPKPQEPLPEFDPKHKLAFEGLMFIGRLTSEFSWLGHDFVIKTLGVEDILSVAIVSAKYAGTMGDIKAYQAAITAACVVTVDGKVLPIPLTTDPEDTLISVRFSYVLRKWYPPILDAVYEQYLLLEAKVDKVIAAMSQVVRLDP